MSFTPTQVYFIVTDDSDQKKFTGFCEEATAKTDWKFSCRQLNSRNLDITVNDNLLLVVYYHRVTSKSFISLNKFIDAYHSSPVARNVPCLIMLASRADNNVEELVAKARFRLLVEPDPKYNRERLEVIVHAIEEQKRKRVYLISTACTELNQAMHVVLEKMGLEVLDDDWVSLQVAATTQLDARIRFALDRAQAVVVLLHPDESAYRPGSEENATGKFMRYQPHPDTIFEFGSVYALMGLHEKLLLIEYAPMSTFSKFARELTKACHYFEMVELTSGSPITVHNLRFRLVNAGCSLDDSSSEFLDPIVFKCS